VKNDSVPAFSKMTLAALFSFVLCCGLFIGAANAASDVDSGDSEPIDDSPVKSRPAVTSGNSKIKIAPAKEGYAVMYIYRPRNRLGAWRKVFFTRDGVDVAKVKNGRYTWIYVPKGRQRFKVGWMREARWNNKNSGLTINFVPGQTYYYWFDNSASYSTYSYPRRYFYFRYRLRPMSRYSAIAAMEKLIYQRTVKTKKKKKKRKSEE
jgi:hypothetical protein